MVFLFQLGAVLAAGVFVALAWTKKARPVDVARALVVLAGAFAYIVFWSHIHQNIDGFRGERIAWRSVPQEQAAVAGAPREPGFQTAFAEWIRGRIHSGDPIYLVPSTTRDEAVYQWFTYRLLPSFQTTEPEQADWLIFYGTTPKESGLRHEIKGVAQRYAPGYSIARTNRAS
jgi:hypothetical protein